MNKIPGEDRRRVPLYLLDKLGKAKVQEMLRVSKVTLWRLEKEIAEIDDEKLIKLLSLITSGEFEIRSGVGLSRTFKLREAKAS